MLVLSPTFGVSPVVGSAMVRPALGGAPGT